MKITINRCFGGFGLSWAAVQAIAKRKGLVASWLDMSPEITLKVYGKPQEDPDSSLVALFMGPRAVSSWEELGNDFREKGFIESTDIPRDDADLAAVVEELGSEKASGKLSKLEVVEIPDGVLWEIDDYDGRESIHEQHRSW